MVIFRLNLGGRLEMGAPTYKHMDGPLPDVSLLVAAEKAIRDRFLDMADAGVAQTKVFSAKRFQPRADGKALLMSAKDEKMVAEITQIEHGWEVIEGLRVNFERDHVGKRYLKSVGEAIKKWNLDDTIFYANKFFAAVEEFRLHANLYAVIQEYKPREALVQDLQLQYVKYLLQGGAGAQFARRADVFFVEFRRFCRHLEAENYEFEIGLREQFLPVSEKKLFLPVVAEEVLSSFDRLKEILQKLDPANLKAKDPKVIEAERLMYDIQALLPKQQSQESEEGAKPDRGRFFKSLAKEKKGAAPIPRGMRIPNDK